MVAQHGPGFVDVQDGHWSNEYTRLVRQLGLMAGDELGLFRPQAPITRGEMAQIAQRFGRLTVGGETPKDAVGHWAEQAIGRTIASGVMVGYPDGTFRPDQPLTRAEAVTTINRLVGRKPTAADRRQSWPDVPVSHWALAQIEEASRGHQFARNADGMERFLDELELETW